jgi:hypothetical protein
MRKPCLCRDHRDLIVTDDRFVAIMYAYGVIGWVVMWLAVTR